LYLPSNKTATSGPEEKYTAEKLFPIKGTDLGCCLEVPPELHQAHFPQGDNVSALDHVGPVEVKENGPDRRHLVAMSIPRVLHELKKEHGVRRLVHEPCVDGKSVSFFWRGGRMFSDSGFSPASHLIVVASLWRSGGGSVAAAFYLQCFCGCFLRIPPIDVRTSSLPFCGCRGPPHPADTYTHARLRECQQCGLNWRERVQRGAV